MRLPKDVRVRLDAAVRKTKRTRTDIVSDALDRALPSIVAESAPLKEGGRYARLLGMAGAGAPYSTYVSGEDVIKEIRAFRGDE